MFAMSQAGVPESAQCNVATMKCCRSLAALLLIGAFVASACSRQSGCNGGLSPTAERFRSLANELVANEKLTGAVSPLMGVDGVCYMPLVMENGTPALMLVVSRQRDYDFDGVVHVSEEYVGLSWKAPLLKSTGADVYSLGGLEGVQLHRIDPSWFYISRRLE